MLRLRGFVLICVLWTVFDMVGPPESRGAEPPGIEIGYLGQDPAKSDSHFKGIEKYTHGELVRLFREHLGVVVRPADSDSARVVIGTADNNTKVASLLAAGEVEPIDEPQGYSICCRVSPDDPADWRLTIVGADARGVLYALRDLEHYYLKNFSAIDGCLTAKAFVAKDYPAIEHRGHWIWGCNMPDKNAWLENMSRWKLNELIHWDNYPPEKAKEYVDFAHSRGIEVVWGFGWGWNPDWNFAIPEEFDHGAGKGVQMCGTDPFNKEFYRREILRKVRELYVPSGCDGVYFQAFTEVPKCGCEGCRDKTKGRIMLDFVNPIVAAIKAEFPDLWISCGIHANLGTYDELKELDPRCNIYWENCDSAVSVRGPDEDFGYINKTLPYAHGFSKTCPADPEYTEESLRRWMEGNASRYTLGRSRSAHRQYFQKMQRWAKNMLQKPSRKRHGSTVADHSVFCRRTPFMHVALAEAQWNPFVDAAERADAICKFLDIDVTGVELPRKVKHDAVGCTLVLTHPSSPRYTGGGNTAVTDGRIAVEADCGDDAWQGFEGHDFEAVIDLGRVRSINGLSSGYLHQTGPGVYLPKKVTYSVSKDGQSFHAVAEVSPKDVSESAKPARALFTAQGLDEDARYVKIHAESVGRIPEGHRAAGRKAWLFVDEVLVNPTMVP